MRRLNLWQPGAVRRLAMILAAGGMCLWAALWALGHHRSGSASTLADLTPADLYLAAALLLAVAGLTGIVLIRRRLAAPLSELTELIERDSGPAALRRAGRHHGGAVGRLTGALADAIERSATDAGGTDMPSPADVAADVADGPTATLWLCPAGRVLRANVRAAELLAAARVEDLLGRDAAELIALPDRPRLEALIDRLAVDGAARCQLQLDAGRGGAELAVEADAVRSGDGRLAAARVALVDISPWTRAQRQQEERARLLRLALDHMPDAVLLVDGDGRVAAFNHALAELVQRPGEQLVGMRCDPATFWDALCPTDKPLLTRRLRQLEVVPDRGVLERFETQRGVFEFHTVPLRRGPDARADAQAGEAGRLWVVRETTPQEHDRRLVRQQRQQLAALKRVGTALARARSVDAVLQHAAAEVRAVLGVEAVGLIVRSHEPGRRCRQVLHRGRQVEMLNVNRALGEALQRHLLPVVMDNPDAAHWQELPLETPWGRALESAGLDCVAAGPLRGTHETLGMVWIGQRGGERLAVTHLHLLETLLPTIAARLHIVELEQRLATLALTDAGTDLPLREPFERALARLDASAPAAVLVAELEPAPGSAAGGADPTGHDSAAMDPAMDPVLDPAIMPAVAERVRAACRRSTFLARLGPARLGLIAPATTPEQARHLADRLRSSVAREPVRTLEGTAVRVALRVGVATILEDGSDPLAVGARAESRVGRSRVAGPLAGEDAGRDAAARRVG